MPFFKITNTAGESVVRAGADIWSAMARSGFAKSEILRAVLVEDYKIGDMINALPVNVPGRHLLRRETRGGL